MQATLLKNQKSILISEENLLLLDYEELNKYRDDYIKEIGRPVYLESVLFASENGFACIAKAS